MLNQECCASGRDMSRAILLTAGWFAVALGWMAYAWGRYSLWQLLAGVAISTLLFAGIAAVNLVSGSRSVIAVLSGSAWLSFAVYWVFFARGHFNLLQNLAILAASFVIFVVLNVVTWVSASSGDNR